MHFSNLVISLLCLQLDIIFSIMAKQTFLDDDFFSLFGSNTNGPGLSSMSVRTCLYFLTNNGSLQHCLLLQILFCSISFDFKDRFALLFDSETTELEELMQLSFVNIMFILSIVLNWCYVSTRYSWTGWKKSFDPPI